MALFFLGNKAAKGKKPNLAAPGAGSCLAAIIPLTHSKGWQPWNVALLAVLLRGMGVSVDLGSQEGQHHPFFSFQTWQSDSVVAVRCVGGLWSLFYTGKREMTSGFQT